MISSDSNSSCQFRTIDSMRVGGKLEKNKTRGDKQKYYLIILSVYLKIIIRNDSNNASINSVNCLKLVEPAPR